MKFLILPIIAYLIGSVPFGLILAKIFCGIDPRRDGSMNIGATNVARLCGLNIGIAALVLDVLKGFVPALIAAGVSDSSLFIGLVGVAAILGHVFPVYLQFKGGKAVATTIGFYLAVSFWLGIIAVVACVLVIAASGYVSLGSLTLVTVVPVLLVLTGHFGLLPAALVILIVVYWRHRENIGRLARGEEKTWRKKTSETESEPESAEAAADEDTTVKK